MYSPMTCIQMYTWYIPKDMWPKAGSNKDLQMLDDHL